MRIIGVMNGWKECPSKWWRYILLPYKREVCPEWTAISVFGFVFFIGDDSNGVS
jgi:hypothetical protein